MVGRVKRQRFGDPKAPLSYGIDVSHHQGHIEWEQVLHAPVQLTLNGVFLSTKVDFVGIRVADGKDIDRTFSTNWKQVTVPRIAYTYFRADRDGDNQADIVLSAIDDAGGLDPRDIVCLDLEDGSKTNVPGGIWQRSGDLPKELVATEALEFLDIVEKRTGKVPMLYTGQTFHWWYSVAAPELAKKFAKYPLWTPSYGDTKKNIGNPLMPTRDGKPFPFSTWTIHQHTSSGMIHNAHGDQLFKGDVNVIRTSDLPRIFGTNTLPTPNPCPSLEGIKRALRDALDLVESMERTNE